MTKKEFAARLLLFLLPWPLSRVLPRALRIYYFGPGGHPPPGWDPGVYPPPWIPSDPGSPFFPFPPSPHPPVDPPSGQWFPHFDDTQWESYYYTFWLTDHWYSKETNFAGLSVISGWSVGYRPTHARVSYTGTVNSIRIRDPFMRPIGVDYAPSSGQAIPLDFTLWSTDITQLTFTTSTLITITNIEFLEA